MKSTTGTAQLDIYPPCPCCGVALTVGVKLPENEFIAWCANGPCPSEIGDNGALGRTEERACKELIQRMNKQPDWETK